MRRYKLTSEYANPDILVDGEWLESHLDDPNIRIVDCDMFDSYQRAHIKGAVGIKVHHYIKHPNYPDSPTDYPWVAEPDVAKQLFQDMGIGDETTVVSYDSNGSLWAARFWWVLNYYGHSNAKVLNGGWKKWFSEGRLISIEPPDSVEVTFNPRANTDLICTLDYGKSKISNKDTIFLDVRSDGEWEGTNSRGNRKSGRVPGAIHLEWTNFITRDSHHTIKTSDELHEILQSAGVTPEKEIITY
ncbi:MAG: hypothetical protein CL887_05410 [Dehalococcoidia bacterium]|nr:hypothetical protein [Dehalococcoidia bacterium]